MNRLSPIAMLFVALGSYMVSCGGCARTKSEEAAITRYDPGDTVHLVAMSREQPEYEPLHRLLDMSSVYVYRHPAGNLYELFMRESCAWNDNTVLIDSPAAIRVTPHPYPSYGGGATVQIIFGDVVIREKEVAFGFGEPYNPDSDSVWTWALRVAVPRIRVRADSCSAPRREAERLERLCIETARVTAERAFLRKVYGIQ